MRASVADVNAESVSFAGGQVWSEPPFFRRQVEKAAFNVEKGNVDRRESNALTGHFVGRRSSRRTRRP